ncbi:UNVERIFIED_ORG: hypothetical protein M2328_006094 [Rhodococcus erythropolis]
MTDAPDPGLTDLIAAHYRTITTAVIYRDDESDGAHRKGFECVCACGDEYMALTQAGDRTEATVLRRADSAHVALVVEQHTNGRIAELEADSRRTAFEDQDHIDELTVRMRRAEDAQDALKAEASGLRYDNEQLQATIARVRAVEAEYLGPEDIDIECREDVWRFIRDLRAALEGEQE